MTLPLSLRGVARQFGRVHAVVDVSLDIQPGTFVGLIGHNGAGKSTLLRMVSGVLRPSAGSIHIEDVDLFADPYTARTHLGVVPEQPELFEYLTGREFLGFAAEVRGADNVEACLALTGLGDDADRQISEYSQGMRRKTAIAAALLGSPKLIVLDEAINGLDPPSAARVKSVLRSRVADGASVLLSTHIVETVEAVADRVVMMAHGRLVEDVQASELPPGGLERLFLERLAQAERSTPPA